MPATVKILYLFLVSILVLFLSHPETTGALLGLQIFLILLLRRWNSNHLRMAKKLIPFTLAILFFYAFFVGTRDQPLISFQSFSIQYSNQGLWLSLTMIGRFFTIFLAAILIRMTMSSQEFISGLVSIRFPEKLAQVLDAILENIEGKRKKKEKKGGRVILITALLKGKPGVLVELVNEYLRKGQERFADRDLAIVSAFSMIIVGMRFLDIIPGFLIAPGYKNMIIIPLFIMAACLTKMRYAAGYVGVVAGIVGLLTGGGKFGIFGVLQFAAPGFLIDLMLPLLRRFPNVWTYALVGFCAGLCRISALLLLAFAFQMPAEFYVFLSPLLVAQCVFGALSAQVTKLLMDHIQIETKGGNQP